MSQNLIAMGFLLALVIVGLGLALTISLVTPTTGSPRRKQPSDDAAAGAYVPIWFGASGSDGGASCPSDGGGSAGCDGGGGGS
jgi:hypothetical protein